MWNRVESAPVFVYIIFAFFERYFMKKIQKGLVISLMSLCMVACAGRKSDSTSSPSDVSTSSEKVSTSSSSTGTSSSKLAPVSSSKNNSSSSSSKSDSSSSSLPSAADDEKKWGKDNVDVMKLHLGGAVLPYVNLGKTATAEYRRSNSDYGAVYVESDISFSDDIVSAVADTFNARGWSVAKSALTVIAMKDELHLTVTLSRSDTGYPVLKAVYDEPFDNTSATDWSDEVKAQFTANLEGNNVPFVYLGSTYIAPTWSSQNRRLDLTGGKWNDQILDLAKAAFLNDKPEGEEAWSVDVDTAGATLTAKKVFPTQAEMNITVSKVNGVDDSGTKMGAFALMTIIYKEGFVVPTGDAAKWPDDMTTEIDTGFHNHMVPYFYMGAKTPTHTYDDFKKMLTITGGGYRSEILDYAETAMKAEKGKVWLVVKNASEDTLYGVKTYDDGCALNVVVKNNGSVATMEVRYFENSTYGANVTAWTDEIKSEFNQHLNYSASEIPFVNLHAEASSTVSGTPVLEVEYDKYDKKVTVSGGKYSASMLQDAYQTYMAAGWTATLSVNTYYGTDFSATKTLANGDVLTAKLEAGIADLEVTVDEAFNIPTGDRAVWSDDVKKAMKGTLNGYVFPYFYLGTTDLKVDSGLGDPEIIGGKWNDGIKESVKASLKNDEEYAWDFDNASDSYEYFKITGNSKTDNGVITLEIENDDGNAVCTFSYKEAFKVPEGDAAVWSADVKKAMTDDLTYTLPYVYIGSMNPSVSSDSGKLELTSSNFDPVIFDNARKAYEGWDVRTGATSDFDRSFAAYKKLDDGSLIRVLIGTKDGSTTLEAYHDAALSDDTATGWNDNFKTSLKKLIGDKTDEVVKQIPYFNTNGYTFSSSRVRNFLSSYLMFSGLTWNGNLTFNAKEVLDKAGWDIETYIPVYNYKQSVLVASKELTDKSSITLSIKPGSRNDGTAIFCVAYQEPLVNDEKVTDWSGDVKKSLNSFLDGYDLPYFNMAIDQKSGFSANYSNSKVELVGTIWNKAIFDNIKTALSNDASGRKWSIYEDDYTNGSKALVATCAVPGTKKHITLKAYRQDSGVNFHGTACPVVDIYYL